MNALERAAAALFPSPGASLVANVKFFRGRSRGVTAEQFADQFSRAEAHIRAENTQPTADIDAD